MSPISGLSEQRRLPRLGKIHLGVKVKNKNGVEYPRPTDYFVCPPEVQGVYGEKPQRLDVIIPVEDEEMWASQYYRQYSRTRGLVCKGDGITCRRMVDTSTGGTANRDTKTVIWKEELPCSGRECPDYQSKKCHEVMNLQFLLPRVPGLGVWQIDSGSINSIRNINSCAAMVRAVCERVSWIPLTLTLEPTEVINPDDGKKKIVRCLNLHHEAGLLELLAASGKAKTELLIAAPVEDQAPLDEIKEVIVEPDIAQAEKDSKELFGEGETKPETLPQPTKSKSSPITEETKGNLPEETKQSAKPKRDMATLKTITDMYKACFTDFKLQPKEVMAELNITSWAQLVMTPVEAYQQIAATREGGQPIE